MPDSTKKGMGFAQNHHKVPAWLIYWFLMRFLSLKEYYICSKKIIRMLIKNFLFVILFFCSSIVTAQKIKSQATATMLKTATSLMEAQQFDAAEEYYKKALSKATVTGDNYSLAAANEGLGNLYTKLDKTDLAIAHYKTAIRLYRNQRLYVIATVVESLLKSVQGIGDLYAGIEVGAKGIKLSIIEVKLSKDREFDYTLKADTSINTDAASLSYQSEKETFDAVTVLWAMARGRYVIPPNKIHIVISSGLKQELDKYGKVDYFANVIRPADMDPMVKITYINPVQESELSLLGIVPQKRRFTATQLDIGSGNTKGGYFNNGKEFFPVTFPLGTKSFQRIIEARSPSDINEYIKIAEQLWKDSLKNIVANEFSIKNEIRSRDILYLSGGVVWAIASLLHPESVNNNYSDLSAGDISTFRKSLVSDFDKLIHPDVSKIYNGENLRSIQKNIARVIGTYDRKALLAGTIWLDELLKEINTENPAKKFIYPKYAYVGWISGYIIKKATQQYIGLVN